MIAGTVQILWPLFALGFFAALGPARGLIWATLVGYLFLPEDYVLNMPGLPPYTKETAIAVSLLLGVVVFRNRFTDGPRPKGDGRARTFILICLAGLVIAPFLTVITNGDTLVNGPRIRSALSMRDAVSMLVELAILFVPVAVAARYLWRPEHMRELLFGIVALGLIYSLLALFEIRMSPQLHRWVYGYFQHDWIQHIRGGGFRPVVFMSHGLSLGFFLLTAAIAALALAREKPDTRSAYLLAGLWTLGVLAISSNFGASLLALVFCPALFLVPRRGQLLMLTAIGVFLLAYPALKQFSATPTQKVLALAERVAPERAASFAFRLDNEVELVDRALQRPAFGWGGWSRARVIDERGRSQSITDGRWIIRFGEQGWFGYLAFFGFLIAPLVFLGRAGRRKDIPAPVMGMAMIWAAMLINLIPNSHLGPVGLLIFGCLMAFVLYDVKAETDTSEHVNPVRPKQPGYTRFGGPAAPPQAAARTDDTDDRGLRYSRDHSVGNT